MSEIPVHPSAYYGLYGSSTHEQGLAVDWSRPNPHPHPHSHPCICPSLNSALAQALYLLADAPEAAAAAAAAAPKDDGGMFGFLADGFEAFLEVLDGMLESAHVPYSYGFAIILLTLFVKVATFPLSQKSVRGGWQS